ncbi:MAG: hypothetical protein CMJ05_02370 [Pelagibacterales bacterium]|nr:hypothetical protein [Pelagibacterales bacterium]|tara:strand:- start:3653 stop:4081 length:429 start_codon:yes stop_codon:yes gene_type:complete
MKFIFLTIFIFFLSNQSSSNEIDSNGIVCENAVQKSKRAPAKNLIYYFNDNNVYGIKVIKQRSPIEISKFLISKYSHDDKEIKWEGENSSKVMKYYASINRNNFTLNLKFFYTTGSKAKNNTEVNFYCKWMPWSQIKESLIK